MTVTLEEAARAAFRSAFDGEPTILAEAPGRVELLGNHTDHNDGLVLAAAIDLSTVVVGRPRPGPVARVWSAIKGAGDSFDVGDIGRQPPKDWRNYHRGVCWALAGAAGPLVEGFDAAIVGDVPLGGGLSSSASLQGAMALFLLHAGLLSRSEETGLDDLDDRARLALARLLRRSENEFVGVQSGPLDQFTSLFGRRDHALTLDCRSFEYERLPLGDPPPAVVVCDTKDPHELADGMYNRRRAECERAVAYFRRQRGADRVSSLRDVTLDDLDAARDALDPVAFRRARHVLTENARVAAGAAALRDGDVAAFGALMSASHASSRDDFENSSPALEALIAAAGSSPGFLGGKLTGAGWAGCTVNLVAPGHADAFKASVRDRYRSATGTDPDIHVCHAAQGAHGRALR
ncbi:MAG TPA: galactokinase [Isosphaeraceae bacterium]|nr:galactokinase [Isosphaeraceae bacterium]